ncbi:MAG: hypothetical protein Q8Q08_01020 [Candidatus Omnitrophota bacterium]|nr:hypothetical protein [Candidatus Omnitrophota bacterium]MDZ4242570.1 hypothetical protein [Candidatus Omnitrophota bacterium]
MNGSPYGFVFNPPNADLETPYIFNVNSANYGFEFQKPALGEGTLCGWGQVCVPEG